MHCCHVSLHDTAQSHLWSCMEAWLGPVRATMNCSCDAARSLLTHRSSRGLKVGAGQHSVRCHAHSGFRNSTLRCSAQSSACALIPLIPKELVPATSQALLLRTLCHTLFGCLQTCH